MLEIKGNKYVGHRWYEDKITPRNLNPAVLTAYRVIWPNGFDPATEPDTHYFWVIDYCLTPGVAIRIGSTRSRRIERSAPAAFLFAPNSRVWRDSRHARLPVETCYLSIRDENKLQLESLLPRGQSHVQFMDPQYVVRDTMLEMVRIGEKQGYGGFRKAQSVLFTLLDMLYTAQPDADGRLTVVSEAMNAPEVGLVERVQSYLGNHLHEHIRLDEVARHLNISVSVLAHRYRAEAGESPMRSLIRLRIDAAKVLILKGLGMKDVADRTGFYDMYHLSKTFKQVEGVSPRDFRATVGGKRPR